MSSVGLRLAVLYTPLTTAGGAERQCVEEARRLVEAGHEVELLTFAHDPAEIPLPAELDGRVRVFGARGPFGRMFALRRHLRRSLPDLLVAHTSPELTWLATRASGIPYVLYHNSPPFYIGTHSNPAMLSRRYRHVFETLTERVAGYGDLYREPPAPPRRRAAGELRAALKHRAFRSARALFVLSERTRRELAALHGVDAAVVRGCLPSPLPRCSAAFARDVLGMNGEPVTLSVCRLEPVKRVDLLVRAFARVRAQVADAQLVVVGKGPEAEALKTLARSLGLEEAVEFTGFVGDEQLWTYYAAADVFAAPAMADFNIAPYEALAMGCRVVWTTEMESEKELEASGAVFVVEPNETALAEGLVSAIRVPGAATPDLSGMTWPARVARLERHYLAAVRPRTQ